MSSLVASPAAPSISGTPEGDALRAAAQLLTQAATAADGGNVEVAFYLSAKGFDAAASARETLRHELETATLQAVIDSATATGKMDSASLSTAAKAFAASQVAP